MPGGDGTGPVGMGPMSGRAAGYCAGYTMPGYTNPVGGTDFWGRGGGRGWGRGGWGRGSRGRGGGGGWRHRHWFHATGLPGWQRAAAGWYHPAAAPFPGPVDPRITKEQELNALQQQAEYFEKALDDLRKRIQEVESRESEQTG